jgi:hypothetical protein
MEKHKFDEKTSNESNGRDGKRNLRDKKFEVTSTW